MKTPAQIISTAISAAILLIGALAANTTFAQPYADTWVGNTSTAWGTVANWSSSNPTPPSAGDYLFFGTAGTAGASLNNALTAGTSFAAITFNSSGSSFTFAGNQIGLTGGITNNNSAVNQTINLAIALGANVTIDDNSSSINNGTTLGGIINGGFGVTNVGTGNITMNVANTFSGGLTILNGRVQGNNANSFGANANVVTVGSGGQAYNNGAVNVANPFVISGIGPDGNGAIRMLQSSSKTWSGNVTLNGNARIADSCTSSSFPEPTITGIIGGTGTVEFGNYAATHGCGINLNPSSANNWTGDLLITCTNANFFGLYCGAVGGTGSQNCISTNANVTIQSPGTGGAELILQNATLTIAGLNSAVNSRCVVGNEKTGSGTLTVGNNNANGNFGGILINGGSAQNSILNLVKNGTGTQFLGGANTYSGSTIVNGGILALTNSGSIVATGQVVVSSATLDISGGASSVISPASFSVTNSAFTVAIASSMTTNVNTLILNLSGTTNIINIAALPVVTSYPARFHIIGYATQNGTNNIGLGSLPVQSPPYSGYITNTGSGTVDLVLTGGPAPVRQLTWLGTDSSNPNNWDVGTSFNWHTNGGAATTYNQLDFITLDDSASNSTVNLTTTLTPSSLLVTNNSLTYTFNGSGSLSGAIGGGLNKQGSGTLILDETPSDNYTGGVTIGGGTLQIGNNDGNGSLGNLQSTTIIDNGALVFNRNNNGFVVSNVISGSGTIANNGSGTVTLAGANAISSVSVNAGTLKLGNNQALGTGNTTTVAVNSTLDLNGFTALHNNSVFAQGSGSSGQGAIDNSSSVNLTPGLTNITMTGNLTIGTSGARWDLRSPGGTTGNPATSTLSTSGNAYNLIKVGPQFFGLVSTTVDPMLANVDVQNGTFDFEGNTTSLGDPTKNLTIESSGILELWNATNQLNKNITLNNGTIFNASGNNTIIGPMTLPGSANITVTNSTLTLSNGGAGITGAGTLSKNNTGTLIISGTDNHSGGTTINDGTLILNGISSNPNNVLTENISQLGVTNSVVLGGNGTNVGPVDIEDTLHPGASGHPGTLTIGNGPGNDYPGNDGTLMFNALGSGNPTAIFDLSSNTVAGSGVNDLIAVNGDFDPNFAHVKINSLNGALNTSSPYTLITYTGVKNNNFNSSVSLLSGISRYQFALNYPAGAVTLTVTGGPALLEWNNNAGNGQWDVQSSQNWFNTGSSANDVFYNQDFVLLDDSIITAPNPLTTVTIPSGIAVSPTAITNNSTTNYSIVGAGKISGAASILKLGASTLTLTTTNDFTGGVIINGGTVQINSGSSGKTALGSGNPIINSGGTLIGNTADAFGYFPNSAPTNIIINGGTISDLGTSSYRITLPNLTFSGGTLTSAVGNNGDASGNYTFFGNGVNSTVTTLSNNMTVVISAGKISFHTVPTTFNVAAGDVAGGATPGVDLLIASVITNFSGEAHGFIKTGSGVIALDNSSPLFSGANTNNAGTLQLGTASDATPLISPIGIGPLFNNSTLNFASSQSVTMNNTIGGTGNLIVSSGIAILNGANTYTGNTTVNSGATLAGIGTIGNGVTVNSGGTISPGTNGVIGILTVNANAHLNGTTEIKLNKNSATNDVLKAANVIYSGTLSVTNLAGTLAAGDQFKIFNAGTYNGAFTSIIPATPGANLAWDTNSLAVSGILKVVSTVVPMPHITSIGLNRTTLTITATNGSASGQFVLLQSTNVALPLAQWTPVLTNTFDGSGNLNLSTNIINPNNQQVFYILSQ